MADIERLRHELENTDLFHDWEELLLELLASVCEERTYPYNAVIFDENSISNELFIIAQGEVHIKIRPSLAKAADTDVQGFQTIAVLRRGQNFGEVAMLDQGRRTAAAICMERNTRLLVLSRDKIIPLCENVPRLGYHLMRSIASDLAVKIRSTDIDLRAQLTWSPAQR